MPFNGSLLRTIRADGMVLENTYDTYGRVTANKVGDTVTNSYVFDNDGNLQKQTDRVANGKVVSMGYQNDCVVFCGDLIVESMAVIPRGKESPRYSIILTKDLRQE